MVKPNINLKIPFGTLTVNQFAVDSINQALINNNLTCGKFVRKFENEFAEICNVSEAVAVSSGTDALILALSVLYDLGAERGDEIILPALSFVATGNAVLHAGFKPVFVDIVPSTLNIDEKNIEPLINNKTRAILPVHLMGKPAEMDKICSIARKHKLLVIEDAAEAHGAFYKGKSLGSIGDMGAFSTYAAHIISTIEGGIITTNNEAYAKILRSLRSHGRSCTCKTCVMNAGELYCAKRFGDQKYEDIRFIFERIGFSSKMNELEAAVGLGNIQEYDNILNKRYLNLKHGMKLIEKLQPFLYTIEEAPYEKIGPHALPIIIGEKATFTRKQLINYLNEYHIDSRTLFSSIPTQCPGFKFLHYAHGDFPNAEYIGMHGIHIGVHQNLTTRHMDYLFEVLQKFLIEYQH